MVVEEVEVVWVEVTVERVGEALEGVIVVVVVVEEVKATSVVAASMDV